MTSPAASTRNGATVSLSTAVAVLVMFSAGSWSSGTDSLAVSGPVSVQAAADRDREAGGLEPGRDRVAVLVGQQRVADRDARQGGVAGVEDLDLVVDDVAGRVPQERSHGVAIHRGGRLGDVQRRELVEREGLAGGGRR